MASITEAARNDEFLVWEANPGISWLSGTLLSGENLKAGAVVGIVTASGKYKEYDPTNSDGSETAKAILVKATDASAADKSAAFLVYHATVNSAELQWFSGASAAQKTTGEGELWTQAKIRALDASTNSLT